MAEQPESARRQPSEKAGLSPSANARAGQETAKPAVAIALQSDSGQARSTHVVAKGSGEVAEQILQLAFDHGVKVRTDADLATILSAVEVESEIPLEALTAVANILSYIYRTEQAPSSEPSSETEPRP